MKRLTLWLLLTLMILMPILSCAETQSGTFTLGEYDGAVYENAYLNLGCRFDGWHYDNQMELAKRNSTSIASLPEDVGAYVQKNNAFLVMFAQSEDGMQNTNISVSYAKDAAFMETLYGMEGIVNMLKDTMRTNMESMARSKGWTDLSLTTIRDEISGETFYGFLVSYQINGTEVYQRQVMLVKDTYVVSITAVSESAVGAMDILHSYYLLDRKQATAAETPAADPGEMIKEEEIEQEKEIVEEITAEEVTVTQETETGTVLAGTVYQDALTGVTMVIPEGWQEASLSRDDYSMLRTKFIPADHGNAVITYSVADYWATQTEAMWSVYGWPQRESMNDISLEMMAAILEMKPEEFEERQVNGIKLFCTELSAEGLTYPLKAAAFMYHGYVNLLQYMSMTDPATDPYYQDYEALLGSITVQ